MIGGLSLLLGVLLGLGSACLPDLWWTAGAGCAASLALLSPLRHDTCLRLLALLLAGMSLATFSTLRWQHLQLRAVGDMRLLLEGTVVNVPARDGAELRFDAEVRIVDGALSRDVDGGLPRDQSIRRARLSWRDAPVAPRVGERWRWLVRVGGLSDTRNFAGGDAERVAFRDRVHLVGRVLPVSLNCRLTLANSSIDSARARIAARIADSVADPDAAALLSALAVGLTDGMSADQWRVFNATGTTHLVAISGLHVTLFALLAFLGARLLWRLLPINACVEREPFALLLGLAAAGAYSLLAGFSVPTQRTWLMLGIFALAKLQARHLGAGRVWSLALIAVLLLDAFAPLWAGFWLSFVAVGLLMASSSRSS